MAVPFICEKAGTPLLRADVASGQKGYRHNRVRCRSEPRQEAASRVWSGYAKEPCVRNPEMSPRLVQHGSSFFDSYVRRSGFADCCRHDNRAYFDERCHSKQTGAAAG